MTQMRSALVIVCYIAVATVTTTTTAFVTVPCLNLASTSRTATHKQRSSHDVSMQVWSDSRAVEDYKNLLLGKQAAPTKDGPSLIVGGGKLGTAMANMGFSDVILNRGETVPEKLEVADGSFTEFPIYVCLPNNELEAFIKEVPVAKKPDLVFLQDGCMEPLLKKYGLCGKDQTQAVVHFTVNKMGSKPKETYVYLGEDNRGEAKYAGISTVCGKWADAFIERLETNNLRCNKLFYNDWRREMFEKTVFDSTVNLIGALHDYPTYGEVGQYYPEEIVQMMRELSRALRGTIAVTLLLGYEERCLALAESRSDQPTQMDPANFKWKNGFFYSFSELAASRGFPDPADLHSQYLGLGRERGVLDF